MSVQVYVRKGRDGQERLVTFALADDDDQAALLELGFAIDGNQAAMYVPLAELNAIQRSIVAMFRERGVRFV